MIGPTFGDELNAAGLAGLPISWDANGIYGRENLTPSQSTALDAVIAAHNPTKLRKNIIAFPVFIGRWTDAEYQLLLQKRAQVINAAGTVNMHLVKEWDQAMSGAQVDLNSPAAQTFKANLVSSAVLTQARADVIFS